ncbi:hypothetical protein VCHA28FP16_130050 [Vibrio chagasii]|nr:hypothetical protein VCHA28FP16_130050 [Vibrio chagasii]
MIRIPYSSKVLTTSEIPYHVRSSLEGMTELVDCEIESDAFLVPNNWK